MNRDQVNELLYQALETETGGTEIYRTAIQCALENDVRKEWEKYLQQTEHHKEILTDVFNRIGLDANRQTPGSKVVHHLGESLVKAMNMAKDSGNRELAQIVAAECIVLAETKDHSNWELIGMVGREIGGDMGSILTNACQKVEEEEDEHLYHNKGWARELHIKSLGMQAVLPPPEEEKDVHSAIEAARAKKSRREFATARK